MYEWKKDLGTPQAGTGICGPCTDNCERGTAHIHDSRWIALVQSSRSGSSPRWQYSAVFLLPERIIWDTCSIVLAGSAL